MTLAEIYLYTWNELVDNEIRRALYSALSIYGSRSKLAEAIDWESSAVKKYLRLKPVEKLAGRQVFSITLADLQASSHKKVVVMTKRAIVAVLCEELGSMRAVARAVGKDSKYLGYLMAEANP